MNNTGSQRGQTLVLITVFMFALLGMCAFAIDVGSWYQQKRSLQSGADAGALAGAALLPNGWSSATSAAGSEFGKNIAGGSLSYQQTTTFTTNDSIIVTASKPSPTYFAQIFGKSSVSIKATAKATMMNAAGGAVPWGVMKQPYVPGTTYPIYVDNSGPNNGALRLPAWDTSSTQCTTGSVNGVGGSALYTAEVAGGVVTTCPVKLNDVLGTKTGQNTGPTTQGVASRCNGLQSPSSIVTFSANGTPTLQQPGSCQLVLLPVVVDANTGASSWPKTGNGDVRVVSFSWWVISAVLQGGKEVDAVYVGEAPVDPTSGSPLPAAFQAQLTG